MKANNKQIEGTGFDKNAKPKNIGIKNIYFRLFFIPKKNK